MRSRDRLVYRSIHAGSNCRDRPVGVAVVSGEVNEVMLVLLV